MNKKKVLITGVLLSVIIIVIVIVGCIFLDNKKDEHIFFEPTLDMFAIMIGEEDAEGNYHYSEYTDETGTPYNKFPKKLSEDGQYGYIINNEKSRCFNASGTVTAATFEQNSLGAIKISDLKDSSFCYIYFDKLELVDFCNKMGIDTLRDCMLVLEDYSSSVDNAITYIKSKGEVNYSDVAPDTTFSPVANDYSQVFKVDFLSNLRIAKSYTYNNESGKYILNNHLEWATLTQDLIDDGYKYVCEGLTDSCTRMYEIDSFTVDNYYGKYNIKPKKFYTYQVQTEFDTQEGLYATVDNDNFTYFYRGSKPNNYVSFGGFIWRIVRINGDGSIRMIYSGETVDANGIDATIGTSRFNAEKYDPRFIGYTYGESLTSRTSETVRRSFTKNAKYFFAKDFTINSDKKYVLVDPISASFQDDYDFLNDGYKYTCVQRQYTSTSTSSPCDVLLEISSYYYNNNTNTNMVEGKYKCEKNSTNYSSTLQTTKDSTIKQYIDNWYTDNIKNKVDNDGKYLSEYLADSIFCNDRNILNAQKYDVSNKQYSTSNIASDGRGYMLSTTTSYGTTEKNLQCKNTTDQFTVSNGNLDYPIGLLTIKELQFAGITSKKNPNNYLSIGYDCFTMSPSRYDASNNHITISGLDEDGFYVSFYSNASYGVRPVINLKSNIKYVSGTGAKENPFVIALP